MSIGLPPSSDLVSSEEVFQELESVCGGEVFTRSAEARRLLRFLVEMERTGRTSDLRETAIGSILYGRRVDYDPKADSIVRVSATRLRGRLDQHYAKHPSTVRIVLPIGSYTPRYQLSSQPATDSAGEAPAPAASSHASAEPVIYAVEPLGVAAATRTHESGPGWAVAIILFLSVMVVLGVLWVTAGRHREELASPRFWVSRPFSRLGGIEEFPAFSPDGGRLVFSWVRSATEDSALYTQELTSDVPQPVTGRANGETRAAWSPDGRKLAFLQPESSGLTQIVVRTLSNGSETRLVTLNGKDPWLCGTPRLSWAPDEHTIFTAAATGADLRCGVVSIHVPDGKVRPLTQPPPGMLGDLEVTVSSDGRTLAFVRSVSYGVSDVYTVSPEGGPVKRVTFDDREIQGIEWKPGSQSLLLAARDADGVLRLVERDLVKGRVTTLTDGSAPAAFPTVAPDGRRIAFTAYRNYTTLYRASSGATTALVHDDSYNAFVRLSPDGRHLAFESDRSGFAEIWISDADGRNGVRLTHSSGAGAHNPSWLPDGRSILFECRDHQHSQLCVVPVDDPAKIRRLAPEDADQVLPSISHDGRFVYFLSNRSGRQEAYRVPLGGGTTEQISVGGAAGVMGSWDGQSVLVESLKGGVGFLRVPTGHPAVTTDILSPGNQPYLLSSLKQVQGGPWVAAPGGLVFYLQAAHPAALMQFDQTTQTMRTFTRLESRGQPFILSMAPDGRSVLYTATVEATSEIEMLEPPRS